MLEKLLKEFKLERNNIRLKVNGKEVRTQSGRLKGYIE